MVNVNKLITFVFGVIVLGSLSALTFGYFTNITADLTSAGYAWAAVLIILGIVIGLVKMFMPRT